MILLTQLKEGLLYRLVESPAVSGARSYTELCLAAKNEERRQAELEKRKQYSRISRPPLVPNPTSKSQGPVSTEQTEETRRCYNCGEPGHLASSCRSRAPSESKGSRKTKTRGVHTSSQEATPHTTSLTDPLSLLSPDTPDESELCQQVTIVDQGSQSMCVPLQVEGVPAYGLVDTGADITIIGAQLFKRVAAVAKLRKKNFKQSDKTPRGYDGKPFTLHGRIEMTLMFDGKEMKTMVYIKMDAVDQL